MAKYKLTHGTHSRFEGATKAESKSVIYKKGSVIELTKAEAESESLKGRVELIVETAAPEKSDEKSQKK